MVFTFNEAIPSDVDDVKYVINFDYPTSSEDYIHRIGRTGRSNNSGTSYAFFTPQNSRQAKALVNVLKEAKQVINPKLLDLADKSGGDLSRSKYLYEVIKFNNCFNT